MRGEDPPYEQKRLCLSYLGQVSGRLWYLTVPPPTVAKKKKEKEQKEKEKRKILSTSIHLFIRLFIHSSTHLLSQRLHQIANYKSQVTGHSKSIIKSPY